MNERFSNLGVAAFLGIKPSTWRSLVARRKAPRADGTDETFGRDYWLRSTIERWNAARPGHGGRPRKQPS